MVEPNPEPAAEKKEVWLGIDLGTTNSCASYFEDGRCEMIQMLEGKTTIPSYVQFKSKKNQILVGESAQKAINLELNNTIYDAKRLIGRYFDEDTVARDMKHWNFTVVKGRNNKPKFKVI